MLFFVLFFCRCGGVFCLFAVVALEPGFTHSLASWVRATRAKTTESKESKKNTGSVLGVYGLHSNPEAQLQSAMLPAAAFLCHPAAPANRKDCSKAMTTASIQGR